MNPNLLKQAEETQADHLTTSVQAIRSEIEGLPKRYDGYGFQGLVENKFNKYFISIAKQYVKTGERRSIVFCGNVGSGKTRLAVAIMKNLKAIQKECLISKVGDIEKKALIPQPARCLFLIADEFFQSCNDAATDHKSKLNLITDFLKYDVTCLDDLGIENVSPAKMENLYLFVNRAYIDERTIFLTTNFSMEELEKLDPRITDRLREIAIIMKFEGDSFR
jgi:DNA replication protein DnaC